MMLTLYGIKNCDTINKAKRWLEDAEIEYKFHDYRVQGLSEAKLQHWSVELGWEQLLNRRSTTWRKLSDQDKVEINEQKAIQLMLANPSLIKRPILDSGEHRVVGFDSANYQQLLK